VAEAVDSDGKLARGVNSLANNIALTATLPLSTSGSANIAIGNNALDKIVNVNDNTAVGSRALVSATTRRNTAIGSNAGGVTTTGEGNTFVGYAAGLTGSQIATVSNTTAIGKQSFTQIDGEIALGDDFQATEVKCRTKRIVTHGIAANYTAFKALTDVVGGLTTLFQISIPASGHAGGMMNYVFKLTKAGGFCTHSGVATFAAHNDAGTVTSIIRESAQLESQIVEGVAVITDTFSITNGAGIITINCAVTSNQGGYTDASILASITVTQDETCVITRL